MNFLHEPATKRDLLTGSAVLALMIVAVVLVATIVAVRLYERYDVVVEDNRVLIERVDDQAVQLEAQQTDLNETDEQIASVPAQIRRQVQTIVRRITRPAPEPTPETVTVRAPSLPAPSLPGREPLRIGRELPSLPLRPVRTPVPRPERPGILPILPRRPERPQAPAAPAPAPAPPVVTPAPPVIEPPIIEPPIIEPPRPGNKPDHAPCPPRNPNC